MTNPGNRQDGIKQIAAGIAMLVESSLLEWDGKKRSFNTVMPDDFENAALKTHPKFGRVMKWVLFSTGAEYLLKGALLVSGHLSPTSAKKFDTAELAPAQIDGWLKDILSDNAKKVVVNDYGRMGTAIKQPLQGLCSFHHDGPECIRLRAAYKLLDNAIRNRDAHAYLKDVRMSNFHLTAIFCYVFNQLLEWTDNDALVAIYAMIDTGPRDS